jgi:hypothetical protein
MKKLFLVLVAAFSFGCTSPSSENQSSLHKLDWLLGSWKNVSSEGTVYERWSKASDNSYSGHGFMIVNNDTVFSERISIEQKGNNVFYIPTVRDQNDGKAVSFKLISNEGSEFIYENKEHDFPQRIIYKSVSPDSLYARVEGTDKGTFRKEEFYLRKDR